MQAIFRTLGPCQDGEWVAEDARTKGGEPSEHPKRRRNVHLKTSSPM